MKYGDNMYIRDDVILISYRKCGRTWLRMMIAMAAKEAGYKTDKKELFRCEHWETNKSNAKKIIYLHRNPLDVVVSHYFEVTRPTRKHPYKGTISEWLREDLPRYLEFHGRWMDYLKGRQAYILSYENLKEDCLRYFGDILSWLEITIEPTIFKEIVEKCQFDKMRKMEKDKHMMSKYRGRFSVKYLEEDPKYRRVRRGKVGGWKEYLTPEDVKWAEGII